MDIGHSLLDIGHLFSDLRASFPEPWTFLVGHWTFPWTFGFRRFQIENVRFRFFGLLFANGPSFF
ncbi:MAG: hypothetical protein IPH31_26265 [Lewinellaceae bacterium]|nr:hypothetical protein [Lewinellaceae bacterium]